MIYAIRCVGGPVKFGYAKDPLKRLESLQTAHHQELYLLAARETSGDVRIERLIHEHCRALRIRGEWFKAEGRAITVAAHIKAGSIEGYLESQPRSALQTMYPSISPRALAAVRHFLKKHVGRKCELEYARAEAQ